MVWAIVHCEKKWGLMASILKTVDETELKLYFLKRYVNL